MHLLIRRTKGYFDGQIDLKHVVRDTRTVSDVLKTWDLKLPYMEFRLRLRQIAEMSLNQAFESIIPWSDSRAVAALPEGSWLLPIDEDDWLHPGFLDIVQSRPIPDRAKILTWGVLRKEADGAGPKDHLHFVESCGYALKLPVDWKMITNHMLVSEQSAKDMHHLKPVLAIRNETPASIGFMLKQGSPRHAIETSIRNRAIDQKRLYLWTKPQANAYYDLLEQASG